MGKGKGILWFVYICVLGMGFSRTTASLTRMMGLSVSAYFLLTASLIIAVLLLIYLPGRLLAGRLGAKGTGRGKAFLSRRRGDGRIRLADWIFLVLLMGALFGVRCFFMPASGSAAGQKAFEQALLGSALSDVSLSELYVWFLSMSLRFFAENEAVLIGNLLLQIAGSCFLYLGIDMLAGALSAKMALIFVICLPVFHNSAFMAEPQNLLLFLAGLLLMGCALCFRLIGRASEAGIRALPGIFAGLLCGAAGFVHMLLCGFFWLFAARLLHFRKKKGFLKAFLCFLCAFGIAFFLLLLQSGTGNGLTMEAAAGLWLSRGVSREYDALLHSPGLSDYWLSIPAYLFSFLAVFGMLDGKRDNGEAWILPLVWVIVLELLGRATLQEQGMRFVLLGVMSGFGVLQTVYVPGKEKECSQKKKQDSRAVDAASPVMLEFVDDFEEDGEGIMEDRVDLGTVKAAEEGVKEQDGVQKPGSWLDNPLPVPKRHVKKEMTYAFEPDPDQMYFDIPVSELDDFDI